MTDETRKKLKHIELFGNRLKQIIEQKKLRGEPTLHTEKLLKQIRETYRELSNPPVDKSLDRKSPDDKIKGQLTLPS